MCTSRGVEPHQSRYVLGVVVLTRRLSYGGVLLLMAHLLWRTASALEPGELLAWCSEPVAAGSPRRGTSDGCDGSMGRDVVTFLRQWALFFCVFAVLVFTEVWRWWGRSSGRPVPDASVHFASVADTTWKAGWFACAFAILLPGPTWIQWAVFAVGAQAGLVFLALAVLPFRFASEEEEREEDRGAPLPPGVLRRSARPG